MEYCRKVDPHYGKKKEKEKEQYKTWGNDMTKRPKNLVLH